MSYVATECPLEDWKLEDADRGTGPLPGIPQLADLPLPATLHLTLVIWPQQLAQLEHANEPELTITGNGFCFQ